MADLLDQLARYGDLLDEVEATWDSPVRHAGPDVIPMRSRRRPRVVALVAAVVVIGLIAVVTLVRSDSGRPPAVEAPATPPVTRPCTSVQDHGGTGRGCVRLEDLDASPQRQTELQSLYGGFPVYPSPESNQVVGVEVPDFGFVPIDLIGQLPMLRDCEALAHQATKSNSVPVIVGSDCRALLQRLGYSAAEFGVGDGSS